MQTETSAAPTEKLVSVQPIELPRLRWFEKRHVLHLATWDSGRVAVVYSWGDFNEELASTTVRTECLAEAP